MSNKRSTRYPLDVKLEAVRRHREDGVPIRQVARELGAAESTVRRWVARTAADGGPDASFRHAPDCMCIRCFRLKF